MFVRLRYHVDVYAVGYSSLRTMKTASSRIEYDENPTQLLVMFEC